MKSARWIASSIVGVGSCFAAETQAAEFGREVTVNTTISLAASRPAATASQNHMFVVVNSAAWGSSTCRQDAVVVKKADNHILAQLMAALASGNAITLYVEDTLRPVDSVTCQVTGIAIAH